MVRDVLSVERVAEILGCKRRQVFNLLARGVLERAPRFGRSLRVFADSVARAQQPQRAKRRKPRTHSPAGFALEEVPL